MTPTLFRNISYWVLLLGCWGFSFCAWAQKKPKEGDKETSAPPVQTYRVEMESNSFDHEHEVHPLPDSSVLLVSSDRSPWFSKSTFALTKYNRQLQQVWRKEVEQQPGSSLYRVTSDQTTSYLLYTTRENKKLLLYRINNATGAVTQTEHKLPSSFAEIKDMKALQGNVFLYALDNIKLNMMLLDPDVEDIRLLPAVFGNEDDLGEFRVDTSANAVEFVVAESNGYRSRLQTKRLDAEGNVIGTYFLQPPMDERDANTLQTARLSPGDTLTKRLFGTYGYRTSMFAMGLFSSDLAGNISYFDFSKLNYFFEFMTPRREKKMKEKFARQEAQGKPLVLRYRLLLHPILPHPQGYAVIGEIYYPQYRGNNYSARTLNPNYPVYGQLPGSRRMFDGYRFTHAIACVFDHQGNLLWDNSFQLSNETYPDLAPTVEAGVAPDGKITLVYPTTEEELKFKTLRPGLSISNEDEVAVQLSTETDKLVGSEGEGIVNWYGNNFLAFGFQRIRPKEGSSRTVFVLQKLTFE